MLTRVGSSVAAVLLLGGLAGCSGDETQTHSAAASTARASEPAMSVPTAPATTSAAATDDPLGTPATTSGPLDASSVPEPLDLGPGWQPYNDPGQAEEGYVGNGSWVRARGVDDVIAGIVPLGCLELTSPPRLPVPAHALEATYRGAGGAPAVALALDYKSSASAAAMLAGMGRIAGSCPAPAARVGKGDPLTVVVHPKRVDASTVLDRRREYGVDASEWMWSEAVVRSGRRVGLLIVASDPSGAAPDLEELASRLRAAVIR